MLCYVMIAAQQQQQGNGESIRLAQFACHSAVLAARSKLLCNLIERRRRCQEPSADPGSSGSATANTEIILDDTVVSHKYADLLLKIMYQVCSARRLLPIVLALAHCN